MALPAGRGFLVEFQFLADKYACLGVRDPRQRRATRVLCAIGSKLRSCQCQDVTQDADATHCDVLNVFRRRKIELNHSSGRCTWFLQTSLTHQWRH